MMAHLVWLVAMVLAAVMLVTPAPAEAAYPCAIYKTFAASGSVTNTDLNSMQTLATTDVAKPDCINDYSANTTEMQTTTDPYPAGSPSLATTLAGELERLRYVIKNVLGWTQWYTHSEHIAFGARGLTSALGTITADRALYSGTVTWNQGGTTFTALKANVTCTACAAASKLIDLQTASTTQFKVDYLGNLQTVGSVAVGSAPAATGSVRLPVNATIKALDNASADQTLVALDSSAMYGVHGGGTVTLTDTGAATDVQDIGATSFGLLVVAIPTTNDVCTFYLRGSGNAAVLGEDGQSGVVCTITKDNAGTLNVYYDGSGKYQVQNNLGGSRTVRLILMGATS